MTIAAEPEINEPEINEPEIKPDTKKADAKKADAKIKAAPGKSVSVFRDVLLVTYAVPEKLVRPHAPQGIGLDRLPGGDGNALAFVQTMCAYCDESQISLLPTDVGGSFHQITHRVLTRTENKRGTFTLRTYLSTGEAHIAQRALSRDADFARVWLYIGGNPAVGVTQNYNLRMVGDLGQVNLEVRAAETKSDGDAKAPAPFASQNEMADFFVRRKETYFRASAPKASSVGVVPTETEWDADADPLFQTGALVSARQTLFSELGIVSAEAQANPFSVLLFKKWLATSRAPRFAKLPGAPLPEKPFVIG